jgi:GAF domain-containing protein/HAMP domain-containing protein
MGTSETNLNLFANRVARNAVFAVIAIASLAFLGISSLISPLLAGESIPPLTVIEIILIAGQIVVSIFSLRWILRTRAEPGAWVLIFTFILTSFFRTGLRESIGLPLGVITAIVVSAIGYLVLEARGAGRATILAYGAGGIIALFDLYASGLYTRQPTPPDLIIATRNLAIFVFVIQLIVLITQSRTLSFRVKIANYFSLFTLVAVVAIGVSGILLINDRLAGVGSATMFILLALEDLRQGTILAGAVVSFLGAVLGVTLAETITNPLSRLADTTTKVAGGNLDARATIDSEDEAGELAQTFNSMAESLKGMVDQLETRVEERTSDLNRRAVEIQAAVEIGRAAASLRDLESLLNRTVELITERFGFYHAGIFLVDEAGEYAVLKAASSEGGKRMLGRGHRLKVGETGIVGFVTRSGRPRIALDVGQDAAYFDNPDLPGTRSEMALPLIVGEQILGALDVQSLESQAFGEQDIATLQILADQLAIAIQNAHLFSETQEALEATRIAYGDISRDAWKRIIKTQSRVSYIAAAPGSIQANNSAPSTDIIRTIESGDVIISAEGQTIGIPIKIRGQAIGALRLKKSDTGNTWSQEEIALAVALSEQLSGALESARLYRESLQRAARESLVSDISAHITALPHVDTILRETVQELGQAIGNASVTFQLLEMPGDGEPGMGPDNGSGKSSVMNDRGKDK